MTRRVLVTGFEPFGGEPVNPSLELAQQLAAEAGAVPGLELHTAALPVDIATLRDALDAALAAARPEAVVLVGQATGRARVCLETLAFNEVRYGASVDNGGHRIDDEVVDADGPAELASTLPLAQLAEDLAPAALPVELSRDAGRYLCNFALYDVLRRHPAVPAAFVHVPLLPEQAERRGRGEASLPLDVSRRCLRALLEALPARLGPSPGEGSAPPGVA